MDPIIAQRTLVKSAPELWSEVGEVQSLARHLGAFGEIRITRLTQETTVAWEGERASGTVELKPSAWGTKVTLTAIPVLDEAQLAAQAQALAQAEAAAKAAAIAKAEAKAAAIAKAEAEAKAAAIAKAEAEALAKAEAEAKAAAEAQAAAEAAAQATLRAKLRRLFRLRPRPVEQAAGETEVIAATTAIEPEIKASVPEPIEAVVPAPIEAVTAVEPEPEIAPQEPQEPTLSPQSAEALAVLTEMLDTLGAAHHRPFSRG
ncbi:MAG: hypothetical protein NTV40_03185 [Solirubrobacterales bacterium]|nr:hypothetical protein [Solirubrobacterales bacterium]